VRWLEIWLAKASTPAAQPTPAAKRPENETWGAISTILFSITAEARRRNPGVRLAGLRILEARAQLGIAGSKSRSNRARFR
jgi:outer membrane protein, multidrug efflux system